jgi:hypothetical protein
MSHRHNSFPSPKAGHVLYIPVQHHHLQMQDLGAIQLSPSGRKKSMSMLPSAFRSRQQQVRNEARSRDWDHTHKHQRALLAAKDL